MIEKEIPRMKMKKQIHVATGQLRYTIPIRSARNNCSDAVSFKAI